MSVGSAGKLWTIPRQVQGLRIRAAAAYGGISIDLAEGYEHLVTNKTPEFLAKFPSGKIPAFEATGGLKLFETTAIARYIAALAKNSTLLGSSLDEQALIDQWISFADSEIFAHARTLNIIVTGQMPYTKPGDVFFREKINKNLAVLEAHLATRTYFVTERITLADISVAAVLKSIFEKYIGAAERATLPNTLRFYNTISNHSAIKPEFGETVFLEKAVQYTPPAKPAKPAKEPAAPAAPKEAKPAPAKKAEEEDDDDEPAIREEPKAKNPLDDLPKSTFNLEDWKRYYSNNDAEGETGSVKWFYDHFDKEGFSVWKVDFKDNQDLTLTYKSSNQIGGFFNRLEASRKYAFGSMGVLGENNNSIITGIFVVRGQDYKPVLDVAPDWESYDYQKIDLENAEQKKFFEDALAWTLEVDGKKWVDGKNFK